MTSVTKLAKLLGLPMVDAKKPLDIHLSKEDTVRAKVNDPTDCAYSRACRRQYKGVIAAYFFRSTAWLQYADRLVRYLLPTAMEKEIVAFDRGGKMSPGHYRLRRPQHSMTLAAQRARSVKRIGRHPGGDGKTRRKVVFRHHTDNIRGSQLPAIRVRKAS